MKATYRITENDYVNVMKLAAKPPSWLLIIYSILTTFLILVAVFGPESVKGGAIGALAGAFIFAVGWCYIVLPIISRTFGRIRSQPGLDVNAVYPQ